MYAFAVNCVFELVMADAVMVLIMGPGFYFSIFSHFFIETTELIVRV